MEKLLKHLICLNIIFLLLSKITVKSKVENITIINEKFIKHLKFTKRPSHTSQH